MKISQDSYGYRAVSLSLLPGFWDPHASRLGLYHIGLTAILSDVKLCNQPNSLSPHGIAMQRDLYFTPVVFPLFSTLISEVTELNGSQPNLDTYSLMTVIRKIWSELPRAFTPTGRGKKTLLGPTLDFDRTCLCNVI